MSAATWGFIGTIVGAVVGTLGTLGATWLQQRHTSRREREASERAAAAGKLAFQRDTLLELQEVLAALIRGYGRAYHLDEIALRQTGEWGRSQLPDDVDSTIHDKSVRMILLGERVDDAAVREHIRAFNEKLARLAVCRDAEAAWDLMLSLAVECTAIQRELGDVFRAL